MDALEHIKKCDTVFRSTDIALITSEICDISWRQIFNIKRFAPTLTQAKKYPSTLTILSNDLCLVWFWFFFLDYHYNSRH